MYMYENCYMYMINFIIEIARYENILKFTKEKRKDFFFIESNTDIYVITLLNTLMTCVCLACHPSSVAGDQ